MGPKSTAFDMTALNLSELESLARAALDPRAYDYFAGGARDELTLRANVDAYRAIDILPRVLVDVAVRDLSTTVLGARATFPVLVAPTAFHKLAHADGEAGTARAAAAAGTVMILSSLSNASV